MAINLSDKLTADHSENYIMSIRLRSGGHSFSAYSPSVSESFFYRDVEFDRTRPYVSSLKECFFENDFLTWFYKQVNVVCVTSQYTLVPAAVFQEKQKAELLAFTFSSPEGRCLSNELKDEPAELVFGVDEDVYEFCSRSLVNPRFVHHVGPLLSLWKKQSRARLPRQLYVVLHRRRMDVACYAQGNLLFVNSFEYEHTDEILTDFAKENIFNVISNHIDFEGVDALDLFAGTGSISFELLSRECRSVTAVEKNNAHASFIAKGAKELKTDSLTLIRGDVFRYLHSAPAQGFDFIFADPPYALKELETIPELIFQNNLLKEGGLLVLEHGKDNNFEENPYFVERRVYGSVNFSIFRATAMEPTNGQ